MGNMSKHYVGHLDRPWLQKHYSKGHCEQSRDVPSTGLVTGRAAVRPAGEKTSLDNLWDDKVEPCCCAVEDMCRIGSKLLTSIEPHREHKFGFHVPPWNSVDHLHLHCFALPHRSCLALKYKVTDTAWAGYMTAAQAVARLQPHEEDLLRAQQ